MQYFYESLIVRKQKPRVAGGFLRFWEHENNFYSITEKLSCQAVARYTKATIFLGREFPPKGKYSH
jgi:hypothetical protein